MTSLSNTFTQQRRLRRAIMRRVWYVFFLSLMLRPALALGVVFGASAIAFWQLVSISSIIENVLAVQVGQLPTYTVSALGQADTAALLAFSGLFLVTSIVVLRALAQFVHLTNPAEATR
jgi:hypothetical protein